MPTLEIAVYDVKDEAFADAHAEVGATLAAFDGHLDWLGLRSTSQPTRFVDLVWWRDLDAAQAAAAALPTRPELAFLTEAIAEIVLFTHVEVTEAPDVVGALRGAPIVEVAVVRPADTSTHAAAHGQVIAALAERDEVVAHLAAPAFGDAVAVDLIGLTSVAAHEAIGAAMMERSELAPFFDPTNEMLVFDLHSVTPA